MREGTLGEIVDEEKIGNVARPKGSMTKEDGAVGKLEGGQWPNIGRKLYFRSSLSRG